jgi:hypothetical protein
MRSVRDGTSTGAWLRIPFLLLDPVLVVLASVVVAILLTGGGVTEIGGRRVDLHSARPFLDVLFVLLAVRYAAAGRGGFLGIGALNRAGGGERAMRLARDLRARLLDVGPGGAARIVLLVIAASTAIKLANAWFHFGFICGDDVEIQEMTFSRILGWKDWKAWDLRSPFYPIFFLYPVQALAYRLGATGTAGLVFAGRLVVVAYSALALWLTYRAAQAFFHIRAIAVLALFILAASKLHTTFGSSELPRSVSVVFLLAAFLLLMGDRDAHRALLAGAAIGIAAAIRFSEAIFLIPAVLGLVLDRRRREALLLACGAIAIAVTVLGLCDWFYWGWPFHSLTHIVDYTVVRGASSRGYQSVLYYLTHLWSWTNLLVFSLALLAVRGRTRVAALWAFAPLLILSLFPHKEARYLIPILPFVSILAAKGLWDLLEGLEATSPNALAGRSRNPLVRWSASFLTPARARHAAFALIGLVLWAGFFELDGFRFRRSEGAVRIARHLSGAAPADGIVIEQAWKAGGRLYLWRNRNVRDLQTERAGDSLYVETSVSPEAVRWVALRRKNVAKYGYDPLLARFGYREVNVPGNRGRSEYRLFHRGG